MTCLRARTGREPIVLVLEDCHWIDALSRDLLEVVGRAAADLPVLVVLAYRPAAEPAGGLGIERIADFSEIALDELDREEASLLIRSKLAQVLGGAGGRADRRRAGRPRDGRGPRAIRSTSRSWSASSPPRAWTRPTPPRSAPCSCPESLHSLVLSRIDTMAEGPRRTLKVASVVGRVFEAPTLPGAYPELGDLEQVVEQLDVLRTVDLVTPGSRSRTARTCSSTSRRRRSPTRACRSRSGPMLHGRIGRYIETAGRRPSSSSSTCSPITSG